MTKFAKLNLSKLVPTRPTRFGTHTDALLLVVGLSAALVGIVPTVALVAKDTLPWVPMPAFVGVAVVLAGYAIVAVVIRRATLGALVGLVVLSTFAANVPLSDTSRFASSLGPSIWLFEPALLAGLCLSVYHGWHRTATFTYTHTLFSAFVAWTLVTAVVGTGPSLLAGLYFTLHFMICLAVFALFAAAVERGVLSLQTVITVVGCAAGAQVLFVFAQFVNSGTFGLTRLGEVRDVYTRIPLEIGPVSVRIGAYLSGLTGNPTTLAALCLFVLPVGCLFVLGFGDDNRRQRLGAAVAIVSALVLIVLTQKESIYGAVAVALGLVACVVLWRRYGEMAKHLPIEPRTVVFTVIGLVLLTAMAVVIKLSAVVAALPSSIHTRIEQWTAVLDALAAHPIVGLGGANFPLIAARYGLRTPYGNVGLSIHNGYLAVLAAGGIVGLVLFCGTFVTILSTGVSLVHAPRERTRPWVVVGVLCGLIAVLALGFWTVLFQSLPGFVMIWVLCGAIVGEASKQLPE